MPNKPTYLEMQTYLASANLDEIEVNTRTNQKLTLVIKPELCESIFGLKPFSRVYTPKGQATVVGLDKFGILWFHLDCDAKQNRGVSKWEDVRDKDSLQAKGITHDEADKNNTINDILFNDIKNPIKMKKFNIDYQLTNNESEALLSADLRLL